MPRGYTQVADDQRSVYDLAVIRISACKGLRLGLQVMLGLADVVLVGTDKRDETEDEEQDKAEARKRLEAEDGQGWEGLDRDEGRM